MSRTPSQTYAEAIAACPNRSPSQAHYWPPDRGGGCRCTTTPAQAHAHWLARQQSPLPTTDQENR